MHSHIYRVLMDDIQATFAQLGSLICAYPWPCGFRVEVGKPPVWVDFVKISVSDLHLSKLNYNYKMKSVILNFNFLLVQKGKLWTLKSKKMKQYGCLGIKMMVIFL